MHLTSLCSQSVKINQKLKKEMHGPKLSHVSFFFNLTHYYLLGGLILITK